MLRVTVVAACALVWTGCAKTAPESPKQKAPAKAAKKAPPNATEKAPPPKPVGTVHFVMPPDGAKVLTQVQAAFGVKGLTVTPAGQGEGDASKGHHHIIIDGKPLDVGVVVPMDEKNIHFGKGQTHTQLTLTPGKHSLTMQFADHAHRSYGPAVAQTIQVEAVATEKPPRVFWVEPAEGAKVKSPVKMKFGVEGWTIRPAGEDPKDHTSGHHHVVVDGKPLTTGEVVPSDAKNIHYGKGQTAAELELEPGEHTLTLQLADGAHRSYGEAAAATIKVTVE